jgi:hypothetical protein
VQAIIRVIALFTVYERGWGTRSINFVGNTIQRGNNSDDVVEVANAVEMASPKEEGEQQVTVNTDEVVASSSQDIAAESPNKRTEFYEKKVSQLTTTNNL